MAYSLRRKHFKRQRILGLVTAPQYTGKGVTCMNMLSEEILQEFADVCEHQDVPLTIKVLSDLSVDPYYDGQRCLDTLKEIFFKLTNYEARRNQEESGEEDEMQRYGRLFVEYGGVDVLIRILMYSSLTNTDMYRTKSPSYQLHLCCKSQCLDILQKLIGMPSGEALASQLMKRDDVTNYVFSLLAQDKTHLTAITYLEDMLQARQAVMNLSRINDIHALLRLFDDRKLANFCRVLAVTISDLDIYENKSSLFAQNKQKRSKGFVNTRDLNQELLLAIPDLLPRLVNLATEKNYTPRYRGVQSELDCWMEWIENSLAESAYDNPVEDDLDDFLGGISVPAVRGGPMVQQSGLRISNDLILRVEVVYVLGLFLVGKHRKKVQRKLAELQLIPGLSELFDQFIWKCQTHRNQTRNRLRGHNQSCECSPEVALKIQFLRLVHSFCDHSDYKHLLLSKSELNEIKRINSKAGPLQVDKLESINKNLMCRGSKGLLTKIVEVMKKEPTASTFRFWLARAVESYLRGSTSYCDQVFLLRRGLLAHIASNIVEHDIRPKEILQSSFDLLGELIKFNVDAFKAFDKVLNNDQKMAKFVSIVNKNLVDSNMFIRSLVLSLEHFCNAQPEFKDYSMKEGRLLVHVADFTTQMTYLRKLINIISVSNLTQENVSCLNTTLVFLMFANQKSELPKYLKYLSTHPTSTTSTECTSQGNIMKNFRDLLIFWQDHYLHKDKDCSALEKSSRISFEYWKTTVSTLTTEDRNQEAAIIHYMEPDTSCRDS